MSRREFFPKGRGDRLRAPSLLVAGAGYQQRSLAVGTTTAYGFPGSEVHHVTGSANMLNMFCKGNMMVVVKEVTTGLEGVS